MSYRKINVDGKQYEYVVGRSHLKIKGFGLFKVSDIGNPIDGTDNFVVSPGTVAKVIKKEPLPASHHCKRHNFTTDQMRYDPFESEIYQKKVLMWNCPQCVDNRADDI